MRAAGELVGQDFEKVTTILRKGHDFENMTTKNVKNCPFGTWALGIAQWASSKSPKTTTNTFLIIIIIHHQLTISSPAAEINSHSFMLYYIRHASRAHFASNSFGPIHFVLEHFRLYTLCFEHVGHLVHLQVVHHVGHQTMPS